MKRILVAATAALFALPLVGTAQQPMQMQQPVAAGPLAAALMAAGQRAMTNMPAAADDMPAEKYSFRPNEGQMSFGHVIAHETQSNETLCAALAGGSATPSEAAPDSAAPKAQLVARLRKSFETCMGVVSKLTESQLADSVPFFGGRKATKARAAVALVSDWADHYAQAAAYLRAAGILPPSARRRM
jgi:uncharacterized damage-inducible protein DinB